MNLKVPAVVSSKIRTDTGALLEVDPAKMAAAAERIGADKYDVLSIGGYRDAKGEFVADYDSVRIEKRNDPQT